MNKVFWLIGLPAAVAFLSAIVSSLAQKQTVIQARSLAAQPSTIVAVEDTDASVVGDRLALPPIRQTFTTQLSSTQSSNTQSSTTASSYRLVISAEDSWDSPLTQAKFFQDKTVLWEKTLPHQYGPKFVLIGANGNVLLLDEFINVASPHAVTLINKKGLTIAQHSFKDIETALNRSAAALTEQATTGWWISAAPLLVEADNCAVIPAGNTLLEINLITGAIGPYDPSSL